jgi:hypothetical protein
MTELIEDFIDITYKIRSSSWNSTLSANTSNWELIQQILSNDALLAALANKTALSAKYINQTIYSIYYSAQHIESVFEFFNSVDRDDKALTETTYVLLVLVVFNVYFMLQYYVVIYIYKLRTDWSLTIM